MPSKKAFNRRKSKLSTFSTFCDCGKLKKSKSLQPLKLDGLKGVCNAIRMDTLSKERYMKEKKPLKFYLATGAFLLVGLLCVVLGFGFGKGWHEVGAWFTSRYAVYVYLAIGLWGFGLLVLALWGHWNGKR